MAELAETLESTAEHTGTAAPQLPEPAGFRLLIALPEVDEKTEGGILKARETMQVEQITTICGFVLKIVRWRRRCEGELCNWPEMHGNRLR